MDTIRFRSWPWALAIMAAAVISAAVPTPTAAQEITTDDVATSSRPLTLSDAIDRALKASPDLAVARRELEASEGTIMQGGVRPNPVIAYLQQDTRQATRTTTLQLNQSIELGGKRRARIEAAERGRDTASLGLDVRRAEISAAVTAAFFDVLVAQERLRLAQASVELAEHATGAASRRVIAGKISPVEETKARVAEAGMRLELTLAASELTTTRRRLAATWGSPTPHFKQVEGDLETLPVLPALTDLNTRLATSPAIQRAQLEVGRRQALAEVERRQRMPNVTVSLGAQRNEELGLDQAILGVSLPIPIFDRNQGNLLEALRRTDKARDERSAAEIRLSNDLAAAYERLKAVHQEVESLHRDILPGAQSAFDAATRGFELGKFSFLEVLDAQRTLFQAKTQHLRALAEAHRSAAEIERILGEASPILFLAPAVTQP